MPAWKITCQASKELESKTSQVASSKNELNRRFFFQAQMAFKFHDYLEMIVKLNA